MLLTTAEWHTQVKTSLTSINNTQEPVHLAYDSRDGYDAFISPIEKASLVNKLPGRMPMFSYILQPRRPSRLICAESEPCPFAAPSSLRPYDRPTRISFVLLPSRRPSRLICAKCEHARWPRPQVFALTIGQPGYHSYYCPLAPEETRACHELDSMNVPATSSNGSRFS